MSLADKLRIMVVDDTSVSRALIVDALDQMGVRGVAIAKDGVAALQRAEGAAGASRHFRHEHAGARRPRACSRRLRENKPTARIGFILVTGSADKTLIERGRRFGLNNYVTKPFTVA